MDHYRDARSLHLLEFPKVLRILAQFAVSQAGKDACAALLPYTDSARLYKRRALVSEVLHLADLREFRVASFPDISALFTLLARERAELDGDAFFALRELFGAAAQVSEVFSDLPEDRFPALLEIAQQVCLPARLAPALKRCLATDGGVQDTASPDLYAVRQEIRKIHQGCTRRVQDFFQHKDLQFILQDDYLTLSADRYVLAVRSNFKGRIKGIVHDYSQTGETCYLEPLFLVELNNSLQEWRRQEREEERRVLLYLTGLVREALPEIEALFAAMVHVDVLGALRLFAVQTDARMLDLNPDAPLALRQARHPLLIFSTGSVVPVDILLEKEQRALVITGGNAGGKTVCLKTLGLLALMSMAGIPVPVEEGSSLPLFEQVLVAMGDEQSLEENLSTFTAQISHLTRFFSVVNKKTLVILDEFGAGTDPAQGAALAQAVLDELLDQEAWIGVATHFPALKAYGLSRERVRAASVIFSPEDHRPLFSLGYDQVGASRALDVAREQGLPESVLIRARDYLHLDAGEAEKIFERLNALAAEKAEELARQKAEGERQKKRVARELERLEKERLRLDQEVREASRKLMDEWKRGRRGHKETRRELAELRASLGAGLVPEAQETSPSLEQLCVGQTVTYKPWDKTGTVQDLDARRKRVRLDIAGVSLWAALADVLVKISAPQKFSGAVHVRRVSTAAPSLRLDLRGMRVDEAEAEVLRFLDQALLAGREEVEIIHGMGAGVLRRAVHEVLHTFPPVRSFALAKADEGGDGMTRVLLGT